MSSTVLQGFLRDDATGALSTVAYSSAVAPLAVSQGFLRDANYQVVTGSAAPLSMSQGFYRDANYSLATVDYASAAAPLGMNQGFLRDASGAVVTISSGSAVAPTGMYEGFVRDANFALVVTATLAQLTLTQVGADNFNRANGPIAGANNWVATSDGSLSISGNEIVLTTGLAGDYRTEVFTSDQYSQCAIQSASLPSGAAIILTVRNTTSNTSYGLFYTNGTPNYQLQIWKRIAGTYTQLGPSVLTNAGSPTTPLPVGTVLQFVVEGSQLTGYVGGVPMISVTDTSIPSGGTPGIMVSNSGALNAWQGGNAHTAALSAATVSDNFNRANGGVSVGQPSWAVMAYSPSVGATVDATIVTNQISYTTVTVHGGDVRTDAFNSDQWSAIQQGTVASTASGFVGATTRNQNGGRSCYLGVFFNNGSYRIYRLDQGAGAGTDTSTLLGTAVTTTGNDPAGTSYTLVSQGSRHSLRVNGAEVLAVTDATYTGGKPGLMMFQTASADNWSAGNV